MKTREIFPSGVKAQREKCGTGAPPDDYTGAGLVLLWPIKFQFAKDCISVGPSFKCTYARPYVACTQFRLAQIRLAPDHPEPNCFRTVWNVLSNYGVCTVVAHVRRWEKSTHSNNILPNKYFKQDKQCTCIVPLWDVLVTVLEMETQQCVLLVLWSYVSLSLSTERNKTSSARVPYHCGTFA
jgi:hypothetical protein